METPKEKLVAAYNHELDYLAKRLPELCGQVSNGDKVSMALFEAVNFAFERREHILQQLVKMESEKQYQ